MKKQDFIFHFHNPNDEEATAVFFLQMILKAKAKQIEESFFSNNIPQEKQFSAIYNKKDEIYV